MPTSARFYHQKAKSNRLILRGPGLEPGPEAEIECWEATILPLNYPRIYVYKEF